MFGAAKKYSYGKQSISYSDMWAVLKVLRSSWLTQGPKVREFEQALCTYTGARYCVAVANATAALHIALLALKISPHDHVVTSPITFVASANSILHAGGTVQFADICSETACIDPCEIEKNITQETKGIMPVHFAGQSCDMERIATIAKSRNLFVIEDAAHALGSCYNDEKVGSCRYSDAAIFSFHPVKNITTGEGGVITTNREDLYEVMLMLRAHGITRDPIRMMKNDGAWYYEQQLLGFNYRITDIQCALGISQLKRLDTFVQQRRELVEVYREEFKDDARFCLLQEKKYSRAAFHLCPLLIDFDEIKINKKNLCAALAHKGVCTQVHYIPVHVQPYYKNLGFVPGSFPHAESYYQRTVSLPLYPLLKSRDVKNIVKIIKATAV
jgi:perosamine synthetase